LFATKFLEPRHVERAVGKLRFVLRLLRRGLVECGLVGARIDLRQTAPFWTSCPSTKFTAISGPSTIALTVTVLYACTVPRPSR